MTYIIISSIIGPRYVPGNPQNMLDDSPNMPAYDDKDCEPMEFTQKKRSRAWMLERLKKVTITPYMAMAEVKEETAETIAHLKSMGLEFPSQSRPQENYVVKLYPMWYADLAEIRINSPSEELVHEYYLLLSRIMADSLDNNGVLEEDGWWPHYQALILDRKHSLKIRHDVQTALAANPRAMELMGALGIALPLEYEARKS